MGKAKVTFNDAALNAHLLTLPERVINSFVVRSTIRLNQVAGRAAAQWPSKSGRTARNFRVLIKHSGGNMTAEIVNSTPYVRETKWSKQPGKAPSGLAGQSPWAVLVVRPMRAELTKLKSELLSDFIKLLKD